MRFTGSGTGPGEGTPFETANADGIDWARIRLTGTGAWVGEGTPFEAVL